MKQLCIKMLMMAWVLSLSIAAHAQDESTNQVTYTIDGVETTTNYTPGELVDALDGKALQVTKIAINGTLFCEDVKTLRLMGGSDENDSSEKNQDKDKFTKQGSLQELDLSKASFKALPYTPAEGATEEEQKDKNPNTFLKSKYQDDGKSDLGINEETKKQKYNWGIVGNGIQLPDLFFSNCDNLVTVTLNENTETIGAGAFRSCANLQECTNLVNSNTTITNIGAHAFAYCPVFDLKNGKGLLPQNLRQIGNGAFTNCCDILDKDQVKKGISYLTIPESVTDIGPGAFGNCRNLKELYFAGDLDADGSAKGNELNVNGNAFVDCQNMVIQDGGQLPNRIINIGDQAFAHNKSTTIILPKNSKITGEPHTIEFNGTLTKSFGIVGNGAFGWCEDALTKVVIPANITYIQDNVFTSAQKLTEIDFANPKAITHIGNGAFASNYLIKDQFTKVTGVTEIGESAFQDCKLLTDEDAEALITKSQIKEVKTQTFAGCTSLTQIDLGTKIEKIGDWSFSGCKALTKLIVRRENIIAYRDKYVENWKYTDNTHKETIKWYEYADKGAFYNINANQVEVVFEGDAEANYSNYRDNDIHSDNYIDYTNSEGTRYYKLEYKGNAFMALLTKTIKETDTEYTVAPQRHADVKLYRNFNTGWNTLMLPFGAQNDDKKGNVKGAEIFKNALSPSGANSTLMMAQYRGLWVKEEEDNSMFYFLRVDGTERLNEFEPIIVRMDANDIKQAKTDGTNQVYTFENVELNYQQDKENDSYTDSYTAKTADEMTQAAVFDGNKDHKLNYKFENCQYTYFNFVGTLVPKSGNDFITWGDYIIQNNNFVKCQEDKKYGLKGFRGFFQKQDNSGAKGSLINLDVVDENGNTTAITQLDGESLSAPATTAAIYNLSGQMVGTDASTLPKGVYVSGGKKFVIK